jgi:hypothetical protein
MNPDVKHNLVNVAIITAPLIISMIAYLLSGAPLERNGHLSFAFLVGSVLSAMVSTFVTLERKWK